MRCRMAATDSPAVRGVDAQARLSRHSGIGGRCRAIHNLNVTTGVHVHLPFVQLAASRRGVCTHAELNNQQRVVHKELLHIVRPRLAIAVAPEGINLRIVYDCVGR